METGLAHVYDTVRAPPTSLTSACVRPVACTRIAPAPSWLGSRPVVCSGHSLIQALSRLSA
eukprot:COSAG06_NODE_3637_length_5065_cov_7.899780_3_plen_61_part_00